MIRCIAFSGSGGHVILAGDAGYRVFKLPEVEEDAPAKVWRAARGVTFVAADANCHTLLLVGAPAGPIGPSPISDRKVGVWSHRFAELEGDFLFGQSVSAGALTRNHAFFLVSGSVPLLFAYSRPLVSTTSFGCFLVATSSPLHILDTDVTGAAVVLFAAPVATGAAAQQNLWRRNPRGAVLSSVAQISQGVVGLALSPEGTAAAIASGIVSVVHLSRGVAGFAQQLYERYSGNSEPEKRESENFPPPFLGALGVIYLPAKEAAARHRPAVGASSIMVPSGDIALASSATPAVIAAHRRPLAAICGIHAKHATLAATVSQLGTLVRIWDVVSGAKLYEFRRGWQVASIKQLSFAPNAAHVVLVTDAGDMRVWSLCQALAKPTHNTNSEESEEDCETYRAPNAKQVFRAAKSANRASICSQWLPSANTRVGALLRRVLPFDADAPLAAGWMRVPPATESAPRRRNRQSKRNAPRGGLVVGGSVDTSEEESSPRGDWVDLTGEFGPADSSTSFLVGFSFLQSADGDDSHTEPPPAVLAVSAVGSAAFWCAAELSVGAGIETAAERSGPIPPLPAGGEQSESESEDRSLRLSALARAFGLGEASCYKSAWDG